MAKRLKKLNRSDVASSPTAPAVMPCAASSPSTYAPHPLSGIDMQTGALVASQ